MQCAEFERRLQQLLDRRLAPATDARLAAHALGCSRCRETLAAWDLLQDGLDLGVNPDPAADFAQRVVVRIEPIRRRNAALRGVSLVAVVAAVIIALLTTFPSSSKPAGSDPAAVTLAEQLARQTVGSSLGPRTEVASAPGDTRTRSERKASSLPRLQPFVLPELPELASVSQRIDSDTIPGVRPITSSLTSAIDLLRRALPGGKEAGDKPQAGINRAISGEPIA